MTNVRRNDLCPCGSGKKYKKCCMLKLYISVGREDSTKTSLVKELLAFCKRHYKYEIDDAYGLFWGERDHENILPYEALPVADINFWEWVVYDWEIDEDNHKTLIDYYREKNKTLGPEKLRLLDRMRDTFISLYEVQEVFPEKGLVLKDLLLGGKYEVKEKMATRSLRKWSIFATRLLMLDGDYILTGSVYPYGIRRKSEIIEDINEWYKDDKRNDPGLTLKEFLKTNSDLFNDYWLEAYEEPQKIELRTSDGQEFVLCKSIFEIKEKDAVIADLEKIRELSQDGENVFIWLEKPLKDGSTILGRFEVKGGRLIFECNSKERLEKGKELVVKRLGDSVIHKVDSFQDPHQAVKAYRDKPRKKTEGEIPMEIQREINTEIMEEHYKKWFDEKISALDDRTPQEAMKTDEGRGKVMDLLKLYENGEEQKKRDGLPCYDLSWVWEKLGIEREQ